MNRASLFIGIGLVTMALFALKKVSASGIEHLKRLEALRLFPYLDEAGYPSIGYGHKIKSGENFDGGITQQQAEVLLRQDLRDAENAVNTLVTVPLNQNQFDALVSFTFNIGVNAFKNSTLLKKLNDYDYQGALAELARWNKVTVNGEKVVSDGLALRRAREQELFIS
jgi:lysozyme